MNERLLVSSIIAASVVGAAYSWLKVFHDVSAHFSGTSGTMLAVMSAGGAATLILSVAFVPLAIIKEKRHQVVLASATRSFHADRKSNVIQFRR